MLVAAITINNANEIGSRGRRRHPLCYFGSWPQRGTAAASAAWPAVGDSCHSAPDPRRHCPGPGTLHNPAWKAPKGKPGRRDSCPHYYPPDGLPMRILVRWVERPRIDLTWLQ